MLSLQTLNIIAFGPNFSNICHSTRFWKSCEILNSRERSWRLWPGPCSSEQSVQTELKRCNSSYSAHQGLKDQQGSARIAAAALASLGALEVTREITSRCRHVGKQWNEVLVGLSFSIRPSVSAHRATQPYGHGLQGFPSKFQWLWPAENSPYWVLRGLAADLAGENTKIRGWKEEAANFCLSVKRPVGFGMKCKLSPQFRSVLHPVGSGM